MRALANFIMRGRVQAAVVALIGLPLLSPAAVALVTLRRGTQDGALLLFWAILPVLATLYFSEVNPLLAMLSMISVAVLYGSAQLLRKTVSWSVTMLGIVAASAAASLMLAQAMPGQVEQVVSALAEFLQQAQAQLPQGQRLVEADQRLVLGYMALMFALFALSALLLGRWWQSSLYNPGGFQTEFHQLRLSPLVAGLCVLSAALSSDQSFVWSNLFALPLLITGIAVVHAVVALKKLGRVWLVMMYIGITILSSVFVFGLVLLAVLDTWIDFRSRIKAQP